MKLEPDLAAAVTELVEKQLIPLRERIKQLEGDTPADRPVGLAEAARIAGVSTDTIYRDPLRYGGWKVDPSKPHSQWRFDPERIKQAAGPSLPISPPKPRRRGRRTVELLPVKDRAA